MFQLLNTGAAARLEIGGRYEGIDQTGSSGLAEALRGRVLEGPGETRPGLRLASAERAAGGPAIEGPYDDLARQIGEAAHRVTDAQVSSVLTATGSEKATFEIIVAAALGAGLSRWQQAMRVLDEATNASARN